MNILNEFLLFVSLLLLLLVLHDSLKLERRSRAQGEGEKQHPPVIGRVRDSWFIPVFRSSSSSPKPAGPKPSHPSATTPPLAAGETSPFPTSFPSISTTANFEIQDFEFRKPSKFGFSI
ncbi:hypothetical protein KFK09_011251 [Dendrobium nobile]|uniref:Uncharacterized protein n=1 Tax=Dendrobium nobile TaxID=94219 RepID=A0A8T3BE28_DENNO|nr:hypothetical protein KFK09_011249 [Dendrobium nobile]KAI0510643.1 hypothetical protein KFK09_011251 [Dendrobium nobile]